MAELRALLLTDVVDSTKLVESLGADAAADLWARADRVARDLLQRHAGREIDKSDGFLLLFERPTDAVAFAAAYHRALARLEPPLRARAGVHLGEVVLRENLPEDVARGAKLLEVEGLAKAVAARTMSAANGGQTLVTEDAAASLRAAGHVVLASPDRATPSDALVLWSHGHWRFKGVERAVELFESGRVGEAAFLPPPDGAKVWRVVWRAEAWQPVRDVPRRLPAERDPFVGRERDLRALAEAVDGARLVSVLGAGGSGKTRLLVHYGWSWLGAWSGGVWFCDLSEARDALGISSAVALALGVQLTGTDPVGQLGHALAARGDCLVILDNFEQVSRFAAETLGVWLDRCPAASFVVTTREVLGVAGEALFPLMPLGEDEAIALFEARARAAKPAFRLADAERPAVAELVRLLDGSPLAIELAAARVRVLSPRQILDRMADRFQLLVASGGRRDRQATLRATLDWSWNLLAPHEQLALAQCSVFEGGFTLEAAEAVLQLPAGSPWPMDVVQSLVDKSLVVPREGPTGPRFTLLVSVHDYAREALVAAGPDQVAQTALRHAEWFAADATEEGLHHLASLDGVGRVAELTPEIDNLRAACERAIRAGQGDLAGRLGELATRLMEDLGAAAAIPGLIDRILLVPGLPLATGFRLAVTGWSSARLQGRPAAEVDGYLARASALATTSGDEGLQLWARGLAHLANSHRQLRLRLDEAGLRDLEEIASRAAQLGNVDAEVDALVLLGEATMPQGITRLDAAVARARAAGNVRVLLRALQRLGVNGLLVRPVREGIAALNEAADVARAARRPLELARMLEAVGFLQGMNLDEARARQALDEGIALARRLGLPQLERDCVARLADALAYTGHLDEARRLIDAAWRLTQDIDSPRERCRLALGWFALEWTRGDRAAIDVVLDDLARSPFQELWRAHRSLEDARLGRYAEALDGVTDVEFAWVSRAIGLFELGDLEGSERLLVPSTPAPQGAVDLWGQGHARDLRARIHLARGRPDLAEPEAAALVATGRAFPGQWPSWKARGLDLAALVALRQGRLDDAEALLDEVRPGPGQSIGPEGRAFHAGIRAQLLHAQGDPEGAAAALEQAQRELVPLGLEPTAPAWRRLAEARAAAGHVSR